MYTKEINERSPLRVFEKSIHGGLGKGNMGVAMSRAGVGKTAFLIGIALDDLMRRRKVLHVAFRDSVDHVRQFYDEIFAEIRKTSHMADALQTHLEVERARMIHTHRGTDFSIVKFEADAEFYEKHLNFHPEVVILDGFNFADAEETELTALKDFAKDRNVELWLSALTHRDDPVTNPEGIPNPVARFSAWLDVIVSLEPGDGAVQVRLLKDHDNPSVEDLHMRLDPRTLLLMEE